MLLRSTSAIRLRQGPAGQGGRLRLLTFPGLTLTVFVAEVRVSDGPVTVAGSAAAAAAAEPERSVEGWPVPGLTSAAKCVEDTQPAARR